MSMECRRLHVVDLGPEEAGGGSVVLGEVLRYHVRDDLIELASEADLRALAPDFTALRRLGERGVIVTAASESPEFDFVSRFFAPAYGIDEDPVTGSAHCCLGPWWSDRLGVADLVGRQLSERGGIVGVGVRGDRVLLAGTAVTVLRGELLG